MCSVVCVCVLCSCVWEVNVRHVRPRFGPYRTSVQLGISWLRSQDALMGRWGPHTQAPTTCAIPSPSPASFEPLLASVGSSFWREQDTYNPCGFGGGVGGGGLQFQQ